MRINDNNQQIEKCVYFDTVKNKCLIIYEKDCKNKKCSFYKTQREYDKMIKTDFLYESFQKGNISEDRYNYLRDYYHRGKRF